MTTPDDEQALLRAAAIQNAQSILQARQRAEAALLQAKRDLESKTEQLAQSLATMRATLESTTDGILAVDAQRHITAYNRRYVDMLGLDPALVAGGDELCVAAEVSRRFADPAGFLARIEEIQASAAADSYDLLELADGRVLERYSQVQSVHGHDHGRVWSFRDITARRRAEVALREETRILELLNETGAMLASKLDIQELLQAVTDAATAISGARFGAFFYNAVDEQGEHFVLYALCGAPREAFDKLGQPRATALFGPTFNGAPAIRCDDVLADPRYGTMGPHHGMPAGHLPVRSYLAAPVVSRSSEVFGGLFFGHPDTGVFTARAERLVVSIASQAAVAIDNARLYAAAQRAALERDALLVSERLARSAAERMSAMKDEFLATLSHELRTPLGAILGWAQVLRRAPGGEAELAKGLDTIERNARMQAQLIEDLLDMSRITSGTVRLELRPVALASVVEAAIETVRLAAAAKAIRIDTRFEARAGAVEGDPNRLQQVVWNLLSNAIKFTPQHGQVTVRLTRAGEQVAIGVSDSGAGIAPEFLPYVFERFRQADGSSTRSYGGLGLGLSIVKSLVELHGGSVRAHSDGAGRGATFTVLLPRIVAPALPAATRAYPAARDLAPPDLAGVSVLVVDDEADARDLMRRVLEDCQARVWTAGSAEEALQLLQRERPDVLVSDIGMPDVDGYEFLRRVRALSAGAGVPAIALTAFAASEDRTKALRAGFLVHVSKPVEPSELAATVASVAGRTGPRA